MKRLLIALLMVGLLAGSAFAAGPLLDEQNRIIFSAADQETTSVFEIHTIVWASFTSSLIVDTNLLTLEDGSGAVIFAMEANAVHQQIVIPIPGGIVVSGLKAEDLTKGYVTVFGKRK
jgi:hypothetical protein